MAELSPLLLDSLACGQEVILPITGTSMTPFLCPDRDCVVLRSVDPASLRVGDVALYRRLDGQYVLHRMVCRVEQPTLTYTMLGDAQWRKEYGVSPACVLAVATAFECKGKRLACDALTYRCRVTVWQWLRPVRRLLMAAWRRIQ